MMNSGDQGKKSLVALLPSTDVTSLFTTFGCGSSGAGAERGKNARKPWRNTPYEKTRSHHEKRPESSQEMPLVTGYCLIGDSMMSRVMTQATKAKPFFNNKLGAKQLGIAVHGQTAGQLLRAIKSKTWAETKLHPKFFLMIGTNNVIKKVPQEQTLKSLASIIAALQSKCSKLVVGTIPPVPRRQDTASKALYEAINNQIMSLQNSESLNVLKIHELFFYESGLKVELFEHDEIHWNKKGMDLVLDLIKETALLSEPAV